MRHRIGPLQAAWLAEIGVDPHWLGLLAAEGPPAAAAPPVIEADRTASRPAADVPASAPQQADRQVPRQAPHQADRIDSPVVDASSPLAAIERDIHACQACGLHAGRTQAVPGTGQCQSPMYLIIGEMPGVADDAAGKPFEGQAGTLLHAMLAGARLPDPDSAYLTNVLKCRPSGGRAAQADEVAACLPHLRRQIDILQPRFILVLGRLAARALLGTHESLEALRGREHHYALPDGATIPVWVTHHPASLLVRPAHKAQAWRDLAALARMARESAPH